MLTGYNAYEEGREFWPSGIIKTKKEVSIKNNVILDKITSDICVFMST